MREKDLLNIEFDKIAAMAARYAVCPETRVLLSAERPFTGTGDVRLLLAQTDAAAQLLLKNGAPHISSCAGANLAVSRAAKGGLLSMAELLNICEALRNFSSLHSWYFGQGAERAPGVLDDIFYVLTPQTELQRSISGAILSDTEMADSASDELYAIRRKIRFAENSIREKLDDTVKSRHNIKYLQEALVSIRNGRFVVPVKAEYRAEIPGIIHDISQSGGTLFVEPAGVVEANAKIMQLRSAEQSEIERILADFTRRVADISVLFEAGWDAMLSADIRIAKASLGLSMNGIKPQVNEEMWFSLVKARHPLLNKDTAVPVDIALGEAYDTLILTGPNTGGKTVALKTAALLSAMAQTGYLLPAHDSTAVCVFEHILADIGDEQSIEQSLSTFSGHISNITGILREVNGKSLVLLDELGAGTDPAEGAALAVSIVENLRKSKALIIATTHYAELKMFALEQAGVQNAGSEFNIETLRPTYRLVIGVPGRSNAFLIGEKLGLPDEVIEGARRHLSGEQLRFESVIAHLENLKLELKTQEEEIIRLRHAAGHQLEEGKRKRDALVSQGEQELAEARRRAKTLTDEVQNAAYGLLDEIKRLQKDARQDSSQKAQRARQIARREAEALSRRGEEGDERPKEGFKALSAAIPGEKVWVPGMKKAGSVIAGPDKAGLVTLRVGTVKTKLPLSHLAAVPRQVRWQVNEVYSNKEGSSGDISLRTPGTELNLLGKTVEEALMDVEKFIDSALMGGLSTVYVIHGRGTGALRSAVTQYLKTNKNIKGFRLGRYGEGEDGVTVVNLS